MGLLFVFFFSVAQRTVIFNLLHSLQFSSMKGSLPVGKNQGIHAMVLLTEDPFLRMLNPPDI